MNMFPWFYDRVVLDTKELLPVLEKQNQLLQSISDNIADHLVMWVSIVVTCILGIITFYIAKQQKQIMLQQHKLDLTNKRWGFLEELKRLEKEYFKFPHSATMEEIANDVSKNYLSFDEKLRLFNKRGLSIFNDDIYTELEVLRKQCQKYHFLLAEYWNVKRQLQDNNTNHQLQSSEIELCKQISDSLLPTYAAWSIMQEKIIDFIQYDKF